MLELVYCNSFFFFAQEIVCCEIVKGLNRGVSRSFIISR